jgi:hypothetical protein
VIASPSPEPPSEAGTDLVVLLPMLYGVRNVVHSGALARLAESGVRSSLLIRRVPDVRPEAFAAFRDAWSMEEIRTVAGESPKGRALLSGVLARAFSRHHGLASHDLYRDWFGRHDGAAARGRTAVVEALGTLASASGSLAMLRRLAERQYRGAFDLTAMRSQLAALAPRMLWSTSCHSALEYPYVLAARDLGIPTLASVLSFDNLSSRPALPVFDHYLVWSEAMKRELRALYPEVGSDDVTVTGTPQFDFHFREDCGWNGERTRRALGLPEGAPYILYAASHISLAPEEPRLVESLAERLRAREALREHWLVLRLHPQDDGARWRGLTAPGRRIVLSPACDAPPDSDGFRIPTLEEQGRLIGSLRHAQACVNIVSTIALDAAILDRPVVGIDFRGEPDAPRDILYGEYEATHYVPLVSSDGIAIAASWAELLDALEEAGSDPSRRREQRGRMVREVCGPVDGRSTERVVAAVRQQLDRLGVPARTGRRVGTAAAV